MEVTRTELERRLAKAQNHPINSSQDIVTFSAFLDDAELKAHVERYESYIENAEPDTYDKEVSDSFNKRDYR